MTTIITTKLKTVDDCENFIRVTSYFLYVLALFLFLSAISNSQDVGNLIDAYLFVLFGWLIRKYKDRVLSVLIFLYSLPVCYYSFYNYINHLSGGQNIVLGMLFVCNSAILVRATFLYYKLNKFSTNYKHFFIKLLVAIVYIVISFIAYCFFSIQADNQLYPAIFFLIMFLNSILLAFIGFFPFGKKIIITQKPAILTSLNMDEKE